MMESQRISQQGRSQAAINMCMLAVEVGVMNMALERGIKIQGNKPTFSMRVLGDH